MPTSRLSYPPPFRYRPTGRFRDPYRFFLSHPPTTEIYTLSLHDALPIFHPPAHRQLESGGREWGGVAATTGGSEWPDDDGAGKDGRHGSADDDSGRQRGRVGHVPVR